jgi:hypothetical protein
MTPITLVALAGVASMIQSITYPWISILGSPIPLSPVILLWCSAIRPSLLILVAMALGLGLDITNPVPLGFWTSMFVLGALTLQATMPQLDRWWWGRFVWLGIFTAALPLYAQLASSEAMVVSAWPFTIAIPALFAIGLAIIPYELIQKRQKISTR